jgi:hypothetical protein
VAADTTLALAWDVPPGVAADAWQVWLSRDGGARWHPVALGLSQPALAWTAPDSALAAARLELTGTRSGRVVAGWLSAPFAVTARGRPPLAPGALELRLAGENPARGAVALESGLGAAGPLRLEVLDVRGARVRVLHDGPVAAGRATWVWDGRDAGGRVVPPGVYLVRARGPVAAVVRRVVVLR